VLRRKWLPGGVRLAVLSLRRQGKETKCGLWLMERHEGGNLPVFVTFAKPDRARVGMTSLSLVIGRRF
jgi:hypothetical protein